MLCTRDVFWQSRDKAPDQWPLHPLVATHTHSIASKKTSDTFRLWHRRNFKSNSTAELWTQISCAYLGGPQQGTASLGLHLHPSLICLIWPFQPFYMDTEFPWVVYVLALCKSFRQCLWRIAGPSHKSQPTWDLFFQNISSNESQMLAR